MEGYVSPSENLAGLIDGNQAWLFRANSKEVQRVEKNVVKGLFSKCDDRIYLEKTTRKALLKELKFRSERDDALMLMLVFVDVRSSDAVRSGAATLLEEFLQEGELHSYLKRILFSKPLPTNEVVDLAECRLFLNGSYPALSKFLNELFSSQALVQEIYDVVCSSAENSAMDEDQIGYLHGVFSHHGVISILAAPSVDVNDANEQDSCRFSCLHKLNSLPGARQVVESVFSNFARDSSGQNSASMAVAARSDASSSRGKQFQLEAAPHEVYKGVKSQITRIEMEVSAGNDDQAMRFADQLVQEQVDRNEASYAAMSLCNLSEKAKAFGNTNLYVHWAEKSVEVAPGDSWAHAQLGDAMIVVENLGRAKESFEKCAALGDVEFGKAGVVRVLRLLFRFKEAIAVLDELESDGYRTPDIVFLRATVLRDLGRYHEAGQAYQDHSRQHPDESHGICGLAATYADQGEFTKSEETYAEAIRLYPGDHVPISGLGFILVKQGKFKPGIRLLRKAIKVCKSTDDISIHSLITALRWQGKYSDAEVTCRKKIATEPHQLNWRLQLVRTLIDCGTLVDAIEEIETAEKLFPETFKIARLKARAFRKHEMFDEALKELDFLKSARPYWLDVLIDRAGLLKQMGHYELAKEQLEQALELNPHNRTAKVSMSVLGHFLGQEYDTKYIVDNKAPVTAADWRFYYRLGLADLSAGDVKLAKMKFAEGVKNCPFPTIKPDFGTAAAVARTLLRQTGTALKTIKNPSNDCAAIQKAIVSGELGKRSEANKILDRIDSKRATNSNVISLVRARYDESDHSDDSKVPSVEEIMKYQVESLLLAA